MSIHLEIDIALMSVSLFLSEFFRTASLCFWQIKHPSYLSLEFVCVWAGRLNRETWVCCHSEDLMDAGPCCHCKVTGVDQFNKVKFITGSDTTVVTLSQWYPLRCIELHYSCQFTTLSCPAFNIYYFSCFFGALAPQPDWLAVTFSRRTGNTTYKLQQSAWVDESVVRGDKKKKKKMLFRFGVILTPESSDIEVLVVGSRVELGHWDPGRALQMTASRKLPSPHEPCLWTVDVQLAEPVKDPMWFKFVKRAGDTLIWEGQWRNIVWIIFFALQLALWNHVFQWTFRANKVINKK